MFSFNTPPTNKYITLYNLYNLICWSIILFGAYTFGTGFYMKAKAHLAQNLIDRAWSESNMIENIKPWPWADTWPVAKIEVPSLNVTQYIMADAHGESLAFGAGLLYGGEALFSGDELSDATTLSGGSHIILAGHRDTHFEFLRDLATEMEIIVYNRNNEKHAYMVYASEIIDSDKEELATSISGDFLTLVTCYPFNSLNAGGSLRYVVHAINIDGLG